MNVAKHPRVTVVFLLYNAAKTLPNLIQSLITQTHPRYSSHSDWLEVLFMNDCSKDRTQAVLNRELDRMGNPSYYRSFTHEENKGLAGTLNQAFQLAKTPYVLTCHCDILFGTDNYIATLLELMEQNPQAGAITGKPTIPKRTDISFAEKTNLITNLMDILPRKSDRNGTRELIPIGFAEGRCDIFRVEALEKVGFYCSTLRTSGEDQLLAARLRDKGYQIYQAPALSYLLSVSDQQNTLFKLVKHQALFGRTHPFILLKNKGTSDGIIGESTSRNRKLRMILRLSQLISILFYLSFPFLIFFSGWPIALLNISIIFLFKYLIFKQHLKTVKLNYFECFLFFIFQPFFDFSYSSGFFYGTLIVLFNRDISRAS